MRTSLTAVCIVVCALCALNSLGNVDATDSTEGPTTASNTSADTSPQSPRAYKDLSKEQRRGVVTLEFKADRNKTNAVVVRQRLLTAVVRILNRKEDLTTAAPPGEPVDKHTTAATVQQTTDSTSATTWSSARRRRSAGNEQQATSSGRYDESGIGLVDVDPAFMDGTLRVALFAADRDRAVLPAAQLVDKLNDNKEEISAEAGVETVSIYAGLPSMPLPQRATIWDLHWNMFVGILILVGVAIIVMLLCCLCFYCCRRRRASHYAGSPETKQPLPADEMVELTPIVPLQCAPPPKPYSDGPKNADESAPSATDDENGWIVPIDQLSPDELDQPDVQISKL